MQQRKAFRGLAAAALAVTISIAASNADAQEKGAGAIVPLPAAMKKTAETYLPGVVGEPVPAFTLQPEMAELSSGTRVYKIVSGPNAGKDEQDIITALSGGGEGKRWSYKSGVRTVFLTEIPGKSLGIVSEEDEKQGVMTRYSPAEPMIYAGMNAGDQRTLHMKVKVYDLSDPDDLEHEGYLDTTLTYVGAYKVTVPAGTYDAALLRWQFKGKIGPATVEDIQARFVAPEVGMVAAAEKRDVAAFLIYNDNTKVGRVLAQLP